MRRIPGGAHTLAIVPSAVLALSVVLTPWYALDRYVPDGWDATWWARAALVAALAAIVALRLRRELAALALATVALVCVLLRAIFPPDFGFAFGGLDVPVERRWGLWVALVAAALAVAAAAALRRAHGTAAAHG